MIGECPSPNKSGCPYADSKRGCVSNQHHAYWPRRAYRTAVERAFRELSENKEQLCVFEHDLLHELEEPPAKPSVEHMVQAIGRATLGGEYAEAA
jgi:hypothetical protein